MDIAALPSLAFNDGDDGDGNLLDEPAGQQGKPTHLFSELLKAKHANLKRQPSSSRRSFYTRSCSTTATTS